MEHKRLRLRGGEVAYRIAGSGPAIVLIHGMASSSSAWDGVMEGMGHAATVIALDLPGHGGSTNPGGDYSLGAHASAVRDLMIALDIPTATLIGHSFGGGVAMQAAYQFPERCERLVLVDSGGLGREVAWGLRALSLPGAELVLSIGCSTRVLDAGRVLGGWLRSVGLHQTSSAREVARCYGSLADPKARTALLRTLRSVVDAGGQRVSASERLALAADIPTLILWGERDRIIPVSHAHATHASIEGSVLEIFPTAGHFPQAEDPQMFVRAVAEFIGSSAPAALSHERLRALLHE